MFSATATSTLLGSLAESGVSSVVKDTPLHVTHIKGVKFSTATLVQFTDQLSVVILPPTETLEWPPPRITTSD
ncbi:hypothetical protein J6590_072128 [Homalodisca vitripennis]|nr:hypothetical protein J6590_072128 [Homalodisca vitripennis]